MTSQITVLVFSLASTTSPPSSVLMLFIHGQWSNQVVSAECVWNILLHKSAFNVPSGVTIIFLGERLKSRRASYLPPCIVLPRSRYRQCAFPAYKLYLTCMVARPLLPDQSQIFGQDQKKRHSCPELARSAKFKLPSIPCGKTPPRPPESAAQLCHIQTYEL